MPLFFFDFTSNGTIEKDDTGTVFPSLEEAYLDACRSALEMSFEKLRHRSDPYGDLIEILDAGRHSLMQVPFADALRPKPSRRPAVQPQCNQIIEACQRKVARGRRLKTEIEEEMVKIQTVAGAICANLERLKH